MSKTIAAVLLSFVAFAAAQGRVLVHEGQSDYAIVVAGDTRTAVVAARELRDYLERATGARLPITREPGAADARIFVGPGEAPEAAGVTVDGLPPEGFRIRTVGRDIYLAGMDLPGRPERVQRTRGMQAGTLTAAYEFLERVAGVRWYGDDDLYIVVPRSETLTVPDLDIAQSPAFEYRCISYSPGGALSEITGRRWRLGNAYAVNHRHNWWQVLPIEQYREEHPEYFALVGGRRTDSYYLRGRHGGQVCTSNPEVVRIFAEAAIEHLGRDPRRNMFPISPNDGGGFCECEGCRALDVPGYVHEEGRHAGTPVLTDRMLTFYNAVADRVLPERPDGFLGAYIYSRYQDPPRRVDRVAPNLALVRVLNSGWRAYTPERQQADRERVAEWTRLNFDGKLFVYDIFEHSSRTGGLLQSHLSVIPERLRAWHEEGAQGAYLYGYGSWETGGPSGYLMGRMLWDPSVDDAAIVEEYFRDLYGPAAALVRAYYEGVEQAWADALEGRAPPALAAEHYLQGPSRVRTAGTVLTAAERIAQNGALLDEAERLAGEGAVRERLARLRDHHDLAAFTAEGLTAAAAVDAGLPDPPEGAMEKLKDVWERREELLARLGEYAPTVVEKLRRGEDSMRSPLRPEAPHYQLAAAGKAALAEGRNLWPRNGYRGLPLGPLPNATPTRHSDGGGACTLAMVDEVPLPDPGRHGTPLLHVSVAADAHASVTAVVRVEPEKAHLITFRYRTADLREHPRHGTSSPRTRVILRDAEGQITVPTTQHYPRASADAEDGLEGWAQFVQAFRTPPNTNRAYVTLFFYCPGQYWLDDLRLVQVD